MINPVNSLTICNPVKVACPGYGKGLRLKTMIDTKLRVKPGSKSADFGNRLIGSDSVQRYKGMSDLSSI